MAWIDPTDGDWLPAICLAAFTAWITWRAFAADGELFGSDPNRLRAAKRPGARYKRASKLGRGLAVSSRDQSKQLLLDVAGKYRYGPLGGYRFKRLVRPGLPDGMDN